MFSFVAPSNDGLLMNGNKVWHAGNDGAGTGLDADLLDGQQGSYYASNSYVASLTTSSVSEGSNLYFTNARARASISVTGNASYDSGTGVIYVPPASVQSIPAGYAGALLYSNTKYTFTASNNQTIFVGADNNGQTLVLADPAKTHVFLNGVLLTANTDYRAYQTNVTLLESTAANNILTIVDGLIALDISNVSSHIVPTTSNVYDLGSVTKYWRDLYLSGNTLRLGNVLIKDIGGSVGFSSPTGSSINLTANILNATRITENGSNVVTQADIGTAPGKIPLNQHLGSMAYESSINYYSTGSALAFKNRIINGAMMIDQRNAGTAVTDPPTNTFVVDRFLFNIETNYLLATTIGQNKNNISPPPGFKNYIGFTVDSIESPSPNPYYNFRQHFEGSHLTDLNWHGTNGKSVTVSFWVRCTKTGRYNVSLRGGDTTACYMSTYTIIQADTWEYKTITIPPPDPSLTTWNSAGTNSFMLTLNFGLANNTGSWAAPDVNKWITGSYTGSTDATNILSTLNASWYITGVQFEIGTQATAFDWRPYTTELQLCQRYYYKVQPEASGNDYAVGSNATTTESRVMVFFPVSMRIAPTALEQSGTATDYTVRHAGTFTACSSVPVFFGSSKNSASTQLTVASGLTAGQGSFLRPANTSAYLAWSAEL
jgi:hypothetical protein